MKVLNYFESGRKEYWLTQIGKSDWSAGAFLYELLEKGTFFEAVGEKSKVLLLTDGDELVSYCTYAERDDIQPTELTPWMGFVYTFPAYRGHRYVGFLFDEIEKLAGEDGVSEVYISTNHTGLYEKYGCEFKTEMKDMDGELSRVYVKKIPKDKASAVHEQQADPADDSWEKLYAAAIAVQNERKISEYVTCGEVAAAVLSKSGKIYTGICIDTCSTLGICAERNAIFNMITQGEQEIDKVLAVMPDGSCGAPCGACRELMVQLMPEKYRDIEIMIDYKQRKVMTLGELTPEWWIG